MSTTFLSKKGFKELQKEISGLEISEKALILELKEIGRAKSRDDKLRRNDVITQLENIQSKIFMKKDILRHAKPLPRKRDRLKIAIGSVVDLVDQQGKIFRYTLVHSLEIGSNPVVPAKFDIHKLSLFWAIFVFILNFRNGIKYY